jgi:hypothetical protein
MPVGLLFGVLSAALVGAGYCLVRRYGRAARYEGIGHPFPWWQGKVGALGWGLILLGMCSALPAALLLFF